MRLEVDKNKKFNSKEAIPMLGHDHQSWDSTPSTASTMYQSADFVDCLYTAAIQIWINSSFLFRINNSCPRRDLNPGLHRYQAHMLPTELSWLGLNGMFNKRWTNFSQKNLADKIIEFKDILCVRYYNIQLEPSIEGINSFAHSWSPLPNSNLMRLRKMQNLFSRPGFKPG